MKKGMRWALTALLCLSLAGAAFGDPIPNFVYYPTLGLVTGNNVRLRNNPGTEGTEIVGMVSALHLVVLGETSVEGDRWYEVEHPTAAGTAWIFGQYLQPVYEEGQQESIRARFLTDLSSTFGNITEKALLLFGKPSGERQAPIEMEGEPNIERVYLDWPGHSAEYLNGSLVGVSVTKGDTPFLGVRIGDSEAKLIEIFGEPESRDDGSLSYRIGEMEHLEFQLKDGHVTEMGYQVYYDIG